MVDPFSALSNRSERWRFCASKLQFFALVTLALNVLCTSTVHAQKLSPIEQLGKQLFFDESLSSPAGQSCASCHSPETGFTGPDSDVNLRTAVYEGAVRGRYGNRKPPSVAYMSFSPPREYKKEDDTWVGGQFWDGRANDLVAQAKGPFLNPLEMNNSSAEEVVSKVRKAAYRGLFDQVFGRQALAPQSEDKAFDMIARAIAAYESSKEVNSFSSKYDDFLANRVKLTAQEERGLKLYAGKANCAACHPHEKAADGTPPLFTDFTYDNLGAPRNESNPFYQADSSVNPDGTKYRDLGLGAEINDEAHAGKVKVPTLRNIAKRPSPDFIKCYLHNGTFKSLKDVVHFYNKRTQEPDQFPPADVQENVNEKELGNLGLTDAEEDDLIAFLETLSDRQQPTRTKGDDQIVSKPESSPLERPATRPDSYQYVREAIRVERFRERRIQEAARNAATRR